MVERLLENDVLLLDTPYLRRIREEGRQEGHQEGRQEGHQEGRQEGRLEGALGMRRHDILQALALRCTPNDPVYRQIAQRLEQVSDEALLETLFAAAIRSDSMTAFLVALDRAH